jgi:alpha-tubulin suppressor-like RCC1 family protein
MRGVWPLALLFLTALGGCTSSPPPTTPIPPTVIDSFGVNPSPVPANVKAMLSWSVAGSNLSCLVDVDGNGVIDQTVQNCSSASRVEHIYLTPGTYTPKLVVRGSNGTTLEKSTQVTVLADNAAPSVMLFAPGPGKPDNLADLSIGWSWRVQDLNLDVTQCKFDAESDGIPEYVGLCSGPPTSNTSSVKPSSVSSFQITHIYPRRGRYTATLTVSDPYSVTTATATTRSPWNTAPVIQTLTAPVDLANVAHIRYEVMDEDQDPLRCTVQIEFLNDSVEDDCSRSTYSRQLLERIPHRIKLTVDDGFGKVSKVLITSPIVVGLSAGDSHFCYLDRNGQPYCWGNGEKGQLGTGESEGRPNIPQPVQMRQVTGRKFIQVGGGVYHTCGLTSQGKAYCWGHDKYGQLGDDSNYGNAVIKLAPVPVDMSQVPGREFVFLAVGAYHACGLTPQGQAYCWGDNGFGYGSDRSGKLGSGSNALVEPTPVAVDMDRVAGGQFVSLSAGWYNTCGLTPEGKAYCWGSNWTWQLGLGSDSEPVETPRVVPLDERLRQISVWGDHACGLTVKNQAYCWGSHRYGQSGIGLDNYGSNTAPGNVKLPGQVANQFWRIEAGGEFSCSLNLGGRIHCWGNDSNEQLGDGSGGTNQPSPVAVENPAYNNSAETFEQIALGWNTACGLTPEQRVYCWGQNQNGEAGLPQSNPNSVPVPNLVEQVWPN